MTDREEACSKSEYGDLNARVFDEYLAREDTEETVLFLAERAVRVGGCVAELGVGTGRIALPLARRGFRVIGVEISAPMAARLREKDPQGLVRLVQSDFAAFDLGERPGLIYIVDGTFTNLWERDQQESCLQAVSAHLAPGGLFVVHLFVPPRKSLHLTEVVSVIERNGAKIEQRFSHDASRQLLEGYAIIYPPEGGEIVCGRALSRYIWVEELDVMALAAGLRLVERWKDWGCQTPSDGQRGEFISVFERV